MYGHLPRRIVAALVVAGGAALGGAGFAQAPVAPGDWPLYSRDPAGTRFSPLTEIDTDNVRSLEVAWSVRISRSFDDEAGGPAGNPQATPVVIDGTMYLPASGHEVLALDAATGTEIWRTALPTALGTDAAHPRPVRTDDGRARCPRWVRRSRFRP